MRIKWKYMKRESALGYCMGTILIVQSNYMQGSIRRALEFNEVEAALSKDCLSDSSILVDISAKNSVDFCAAL